MRCERVVGLASVIHEYGLSKAGIWTKKQKRGYQRCLSGVQRAYSNKWNLWFLTVTSSAKREYDTLYRDFGVLIKRLKRFFLKLDYFAVKTHEGHGVVHSLVNLYDFEIDYQSFHAFVVAEWENIHFAYEVRVIKTYGSIKKISAYLVQYLAVQKGTTQISMSRDWVFKGFCKTWRKLCRDKKYDMSVILPIWRMMIASKGL